MISVFSTSARLLIYRIFLFSILVYISKKKKKKCLTDPAIGRRNNNDGCQLCTHKYCIGATSVHRGLLGVAESRETNAHTVDGIFRISKFVITGKKLSRLYDVSWPFFFFFQIPLLSFRHCFSLPPPPQLIVTWKKVYKRKIRKYLFITYRATESIFGSIQFRALSFGPTDLENIFRRRERERTQSGRRFFFLFFCRKPFCRIF